MIVNMAGTWQKGLIVLGLATAMFAFPAMGIEVRHGNLTLHTIGRSFLCSLSPRVRLHMPLS
jgi:hypothetical protein